MPATNMLPLYHDPHFTFRFAEDRIIPRFQLEGVQAGRIGSRSCWDLEEHEQNCEKRDI